MPANRDLGADIARIIAFCSVVSVHFFLNTEFYNEPVIGKRMFCMVILRTLFMICVPLFMLLTGYLQSEKTIAVERHAIHRHVSRLSTVLTTYIISVLLKFLFKRFYLGENISVFGGAVLVIAEFTNYAWYINMYIGLFLMIPFLNILWQNIEDRAGHRILVGIMLFLTMAPSVFNIYDIRTPEALIKPWISKNYTPIVPNWWVTVYPITYYYLGAYLKKYINPRFYSSKKLACIFLFTVLVFGIYNIWRSYSIPFVKGIWCHGWGSLQNTIMSVLAFLTILSVNYEPIRKYSKTISNLSRLTLGAYLLSWIPDKLFYPLLVQREPDMIQQIYYFPVIVPAVILASMTLSYLADIFAKWVHILCSYLRLTRGTIHGS